MVVSISVERRLSQQKKLYTAIVADLGYRKVNLVFGSSLIAEILDSSVHRVSQALDLVADSSGVASIPLCSFDTDLFAKVIS